LNSTLFPRPKTYWLTETDMSTTIVGSFETRREAEIALEHLVQEYGIDRSSISVEPAGQENSAGVREAGADIESGHPGVAKRGAAELAGLVEVSVDCRTADRAAVEAAFKSADVKLIRSY
jgi:hypothetical protein